MEWALVAYGWRRVSGRRPYDQWGLEPACQSGPDVAAYPVLLPPTLGEHVEQNVSLATSSALASGDWSVCRCYGAPTSVPCHGSGTTEARPPGKQYTPVVPHGGLGVLSRQAAKSRPGFSEQIIFSGSRSAGASRVERG